MENRFIKKTNIIRFALIILVFNSKLLICNDTDTNSIFTIDFNELNKNNNQLGEVLVPALRNLSEYKYSIKNIYNIADLYRDTIQRNYTFYEKTLDSLIKTTSKYFYHYHYNSRLSDDTLKYKSFMIFTAFTFYHRKFPCFANILIISDSNNNNKIFYSSSKDYYLKDIADSSFVKKMYNFQSNYENKSIYVNHNISGLDNQFYLFIYGDSTSIQKYFLFEAIDTGIYYGEKHKKAQLIFDSIRNEINRIMCNEYCK